MLLLKKIVTAVVLCPLFYLLFSFASTAMIPKTVPPHGPRRDPQEAKDFKVVVRLDSPPDNLRPGLSTTAKIKTAEKKSVIAIPIQALAVRTRKDLEEAAKNAKGQGSSGVTLAAPPPASPGDPKKDEVQGVFVVNGKKAIFRPVETGITGVTDIEVVSGLKPGDEIVTGTYQVIRTLRNQNQVKVDNRVAQLKT